VTATLSKSDYKAARTCATKLFYREKGYPSTWDDNKYLALLAQGGYMVEKMAKLLFPEGRELPYDGSAEASARLTAEAMDADRVTIFEGTFLHRGRLARVDILDKCGTVFDVIEVKSGSYSSREAAARAAAGQTNPFRTKKGAIAAWRRTYLEDVTFQVLVLRALFPLATVRASLALVDTDRTSSDDAIHRFFRVRREETDGSGIPRVVVDFTGNVERLREDHLIAVVDVTDEVDELAAEVDAVAEYYVGSLVPEVTKIAAVPSVNCRGCEYRVPKSNARNGFVECWGERAKPDPHLLDLCYVSTIGPKIDPVPNQLIRQGRCSLYDLPLEALVKKDGEIGVRNRRQIVQIEHTRAGTGWISEDLKQFIGQQSYPLHFIDFETSALAVPYHAGMKPYENVAFQWSCHTIRAPGAAPVHTAWINDVDAFPNLEFVRTLRDCIGVAGTVFMWAFHERTVLRQIRLQLERYGLAEPELTDWITGLAGVAGDDEDEEADPGRLVDLNRLTVDGFFLPEMAGRTSIKWVVAAVWAADAAVRHEFAQYERYRDGLLLDPYEALDPIEIAGSRISVVEGTEAMIAYQEMLYGESRDNPARREAYKRQLLQYCELDTAAMVMIWRHWAGSACGSSNS
jgi:CRISPR/Cas system-associated exonuclease Cas4 (RecB family)